MDYFKYIQNNSMIGVTVGATNEKARATTISSLFAQIEYLYKEYLQAGFPAGKMVTTYAIALQMLESDWMTSNVANTDNNYWGITFINKPYQKATAGLKKPEGGNYAHFATYMDGLRDFLRILSLNTGGRGRPIDATTAQQFMDALKTNGYFADPNYYTKFNAALRKVSEALEWGKKQGHQFTQQYSQGQNTFTYTPGQGLTSNEAFDLDRWWTNTQNWARNNPGSAIAAGLALLLGIGLVKKALD